MQPEQPTDAYAGAAEVPCYGILLVEGVATGDMPRREFAPGSMTFAPLPLSITWQQYEGPGHDGAAVIGRIDQIWRDGALIRYAGALDNVGEMGREAIRLRVGNFVRGVSIRADDLEECDVELVFPPAPSADGLMPPPDDDELPGGIEPVSGPPAPGQPDDEGPGGIEPVSAPPAPGEVEPVSAPPIIIDMMGPDMGAPVKEIYHAGRIRSATLLAVPAFVEATLELGECPYTPPSGPGEAMQPMTAGAVAPNGGPTSDAAWDGPGNEKRLPSPMSMATARDFYAWIDESQAQNGQVPKTAGKFGHHEVGADGTPGAANIKACQSGIGILNGGRGGTAIPSADVQGVYNHLAGHLRDAKLEPPPLTMSLSAATVPPSGNGPEAPNPSPFQPVAASARTNGIGATLVAATGPDGSYTITIPAIWPESWFQEPAELPPFGAINITADGRIYGLLAPAQVTHRGFRASGRNIEAPRNIDYSEFQNKAALVAGADGQIYKINAGTVTFGCGHASPVDPRRADPNWAAQHYDNSCSVAARVRVGENRFGTWVAGGLVHGIEAQAVEQMMGCALSGDWQGGKLKAALLVPVEGFPRPTKASLRVREDAVVASAVPLNFMQPVEDPIIAAAFDILEMTTGRGPDKAFAELTDWRFSELQRERG